MDLSIGSTAYIIGVCQYPHRAGLLRRSSGGEKLYQEHADGAQERHAGGVRRRPAEHAIPVLQPRGRDPDPLVPFLSFLI